MLINVTTSHTDWVNVLLGIEICVCKWTDLAAECKSEDHGSIACRDSRAISSLNRQEWLWGPSSFPLHRENMTLSANVRRLGSEAGRLLPSSFDVRKEWSQTSTPQCPFMTCKGKIYFSFTFYFSDVPAVKLQPKNSMNFVCVFLFLP